MLASIPALRTNVVTFDTSVADLTEKMSDPVDVLMGVQLGGGTDINRALAYCQGLVTRPRDTTVVLITDLYEGGDNEEMLKRAAAIAGSGVTMVTLLALADTGAPSFDENNAAALAALGIPSFACTPDRFPELMAAAIQGWDLGQWAAEHGMTTSRPAMAGIDQTTGAAEHARAAGRRGHGGAPLPAGGAGNIGLDPLNHPSSGAA